MKPEPANMKYLWYTALLVLFCQFIPSQLQYDRQAPLEFWRFFTGHFVHWDLNHLCWDLLLFLILGHLLIKENSGIFLTNLLLCPWLISLFMWIFEPNMIHYRGISGIDAALFTSLAYLWIQNGRKELKIIGLLQLLLMTAKIIFEYSTYNTVFADALSYTVMPIAHLTGAIIGYLVVVLSHKLRSYLPISSYFN